MDDLPAAVHGGRLDEVEILGGILMLEDFDGDEIGGGEGADGCEEINLLRRGFEHLVRLLVDEGKIRETEETRMADHDLRAFQKRLVMLFEGWRVEVVDETLSGLVAFRSDVDGQVESEGGFDIFVQIGGLAGGDFRIFEIPVAVRNEAMRSSGWRGIRGSC